MLQGDYEKLCEDAREFVQNSDEKILLKPDERGKPSTIFTMSPRPRGKLNLNGFCGVIAVNLEKGVVDVGGKTTFKALVDFLLPFDRIPDLVPELETITIGGAISGVAIESSSFRSGLMHENVVEVEVLCGDGKIRICNESENVDLFNGIHHSMGTLGYILRAKIKIREVSKNVKVRVQRVADLEAATALLKSACEDENSLFVEGIVYCKDDIDIITIIDTAEETSSKKIPEDGRYIDLIRSHDDFTLSVHDYLWRWDCDMFWGTSFKVVGIDVLGFLGLPCVRRCLGRAVLRSSILWRIGSTLQRSVGKFLQHYGLTENVIQDLGVSIENVPGFVEGMMTLASPRPIWLCPFRVKKTIPFFPVEVGLHVDCMMVGQQYLPSGSVNDALDALLEKYGGSKTFYSDVMYTAEEIHEKYNGEIYSQLKRKVDPDNTFPTIVDKICTKK